LIPAAAEQAPWLGLAIRKNPVKNTATSPAESLTLKASVGKISIVEMNGSSLKLWINSPEVRKRFLVSWRACLEEIFRRVMKTPIARANSILNPE